MSKLHVFFDRRMVVEVPLESPSPRKPGEVVAQWRERYPIEIAGYAPATVDDFYLAHDRKHVDGVLDLTIKNGMDTLHQEVADSLPWTVGSMIAAARHAMHQRVAVSPSSGFHHAGHDFSWGFCTFNGLVVAAQKLLIEDQLIQVGILDFDQHQGDGSEDIIAKLGLQDRIVHLTGRTNYPRECAAFFDAVPRLLNSLRGCGIVLYQAGADQHINDPLGGFLNDEQLRRRDRMVFEFMHSARIPIAWNLAGGYQESSVDGVRSIQKVLDIHNATLEECLSVYGFA